MSKAVIVFIDDDLVRVFSSFRNADIFCHKAKYHLHPDFKNYTIWIQIFEMDTDKPPKFVNWSKLIKEKI